jgi:hypothetical protein
VREDSTGRVAAPGAAVMDAAWAGIATAVLRPVLGPLTTNRVRVPLGVPTGVLAARRPSPPAAAVVTTETVRLAAPTGPSYRSSSGSGPARRSGSGAGLEQRADLDEQLVLVT